MPLAARGIASAFVLLAACSDAGLKTYNTDPTAEISSHVDGDTVREGYAETLRGVVGDANHSLDTLSASWVVGGDAVCDGLTPDAEGVVLCEHTFLPGVDDILLEVRDPKGGSGSARVTVDVQPTDAPVAQITAPVTGERYYAGALLAFQGTVSDGEDAPDALTVTWETSELGDLGLPVDVTSEGAVEAFGQLPEGEHAVRLRVVDTTGKEGWTRRSSRWARPTPRPAVRSPRRRMAAPGAEGSEVRFEATVSDPDVQADALTVTWTSDLDDLLREPRPARPARSPSPTAISPWAPTTSP